MAYNKTTWVTGDTITAEKLNNIENGISINGRIDFYGNDLSVSYSDIENMMNNGVLPWLFVVPTETIYPLLVCTYYDDQCRVSFGYGSNYSFHATEKDEPLAYDSDDE